MAFPDPVDTSATQPLKSKRTRKSAVRPWLLEMTASLPHAIPRIQPPTQDLNKGISRHARVEGKTHVVPPLAKELQATKGR